MTVLEQRISDLTRSVDELAAPQPHEYQEEQLEWDKSAVKTEALEALWWDGGSGASAYLMLCLCVELGHVDGVCLIGA